MNFKTASKHFNEAARAAQQKNDESSKLLALGLAALTEAIEAELFVIKTKANGMDSDVKSMRR